MTNKNITDSQKQALKIIGDMGGWVIWNYIRYMGMNAPSVLVALVDKGLLEERSVKTAYGYIIKQWRIPKPQTTSKP